MAISVRGIVHLWLLSISGILCLAGCRQPQLKVPYYADARFTPIWEITATQLDTLHRIGSFRFTDQHNQEITDADIAGKVCLSNFFFTSCAGICPRMTKNMLELARHFCNNKRVVLLSHSVMPEQDSVSRLQAYAERNGINAPQWHLLTGTRGEIHRIARSAYYATEEEGLYEDSTAFLHTEHMVLVDGRGHIRGLYNGTQAIELSRIISDIEALLQEG